MTSSPEITLDNSSTSQPQLQPLEQAIPAPAGKVYFEYRRMLLRLLKPTEYVILEALNLRANPRNGGWCWPTQGTIAEDTGITSPTTIISAIALLKELGVLEVARRKTLFYRPVKPTIPLLLRLGSLDVGAIRRSLLPGGKCNVPEKSELQKMKVSEVPEKSELQKMKVSEVPESEELQNLEVSKVPEFGVSEFHFLEESLPENGASKFQKMEPNESNRTESNKTDLSECKELTRIHSGSPDSSAGKNWDYTEIKDFRLRQISTGQQYRTKPQEREKGSYAGTRTARRNDSRQERPGGRSSSGRTAGELRKEFECFRLPGS